MKIKLSNIHHNPHRNMKRNPINKDQVKTLIDSFERNGTWPNVVVRSKADQRGHYELAYGHHRLDAMIKTGLTAAEFIVQDIDDWGMYTAMVDENESQQVVTPELVTENIEAGIKFLEPVVQAAETLEEFRGLVPRGTDPEPNNAEAMYQQVRNNVLSGEGLGVKFLHRELPGKRSTRMENIQVVVDTHYEKTKAKAKEKRAAAKRKDAEAKRKASDAADSATKAAKLKAEADKLESEANKLAAEARKLRDSGISQDILLAFESVKGMTEFARTVKANNIPKSKHLAAFEEVRGESANNIRRKLEVWWFKASGKAARMQAEAKRSAFKRKNKGKSLDEFAEGMPPDIREMIKKMDALAPYANQIENAKLKGSIVTACHNLEESAKRLRESIDAVQEITVNEAKRLLEAS